MGQQRSQYDAKSPVVHLYHTCITFLLHLYQALEPILVSPLLNLSHTCVRAITRTCLLHLYYSCITPVLEAGSQYDERATYATCPAVALISL